MNFTPSVFIAFKSLREHHSTALSIVLSPMEWSHDATGPELTAGKNRRNHIFGRRMSAKHDLKDGQTGLIPKPCLHDATAGLFVMQFLQPEVIFLLTSLIKQEQI